MDERANGALRAELQFGPVRGRRRVYVRDRAFGYRRLPIYEPRAERIRRDGKGSLRPLAGEPRFQDLEDKHGTRRGDSSSNATGWGGRPSRPL